MTGGSRGRPVRELVGDLVRCRGCWLVFAAVAAGVTLLYTLLLPFAFTQRLSFANWRYLTGGLLAWSLLLGAGMGFVAAVQAYAVRRLAASRPSDRSVTVGGIALLGGVLPSLLCCSPIVPTALGLLGVSTVGAFRLTGDLQYFFASHETDFLLGSLALVLLSGWWGLRQTARSGCLTGEACPAGAPGAGTSEGAG